jgi:hypothetical protein
VPRPRGLQVEDLDRDVLSGVDAADEGADLPAGYAFYDLAEALLGGVLEVHAGVAEALVLAHLDERSLDWGEAVLRRAEDRVRAGEVGLGLGRTAAEEVLVETDHFAGELGSHRVGG